MTPVGASCLLGKASSVNLEIIVCALSCKICSPAYARSIILMAASAVWICAPPPDQLWFLSLYLGKARAKLLLIKTKIIVESANAVFILQVFYRRCLLFSAILCSICTYCCIFVMNIITTNDNSPSEALPTRPRVNDPFSMGIPQSLRPHVDDHPFVGPSMTQALHLPTPPIKPQFSKYPLCCITNDNSPNALSEELEHELIDHYIPTPKNNGTLKGTRTHDIHDVLLHYFCDSRERDLRSLCNAMQKAHVYTACTKSMSRDPILKQAQQERKASNIENRSFAIKRLQSYSLTK